MCGIIGYTGQRAAGPIVIEGLKRLEYRGYDSAGIALLEQGQELFVAKVAGKLDNLDARLEGVLPTAVSGIGHTRWATHGEPTEANAHPHLDPLRRVAIVHNGIVENFESLRGRYLELGARFESDTDSEVIAHMLAEQLEKGTDLAEALRLVCTELAGAHAIVAATREDPGRLVAVRVGNAGGLVIGYGQGENFVSSDLAALLPHTRRVSFLDPEELADVRSGEVIFHGPDGQVIEKVPETQPYDPVAAVKGRYKHFMLKEIHEQPDGVLDAIRGRYLLDPPRVELEATPSASIGFNSDSDTLSDERIRAFKRVVLIAMGSSMYAAMVARHYFERLAGIPTDVDNAAEFRYRSPVLDDQTLVVSVAQSGETVDTLSAMEQARAAGCPQITICNTPGSQATRLADASVFIRVGPEIAVASTKTMTGSMITLHALAMRLGHARGTLNQETETRQVEAVLRLPSAIGDALLVESRIREIAVRYAQFDDFLYLGRALSYPIAMEGALKLKEVAYIHAEGYPAGEMKHGPIALIDERMPTVAIAVDDGLREKMRSNIEEVKARRGRLIALVSAGDDSLDEVADEVISLPRVDPLLTPMVSVIAMQLLAYHIAIERGCDVDQPRNLAKTVTVE